MVEQASKKAKPKYLIRQQPVSEFDVIHKHRKADEPPKKQELVVEQVIQKKSEQALTADVSAIEKRIEEQKRKVGPLVKSRVVQTTFEARKQKRERVAARAETDQRRRLEKEQEKGAAKLRKLRNE